KGTAHTGLIFKENRTLQLGAREVTLGRPAQRKSRRAKTLREEMLMLGLMQDWPLLCHRIIDHAATFHGQRKVITRSVEGPIVETTYAEIRARALKVAQRLEKAGIREGDRVATLC